MMEKFKKVVLVLLFCFLGIIIYDALTKTSFNAYFSSVFPYPLFIILCFCYFLFYFIRFVFKLIDKIGFKKYMVWVLFGIAFILELLIFINFKAFPITDELSICDYALAFINNFNNSNFGMVSEYITRYSNNNMYLAIVVGIMRLARVLKFINYKSLLFILNVISLNLSLLFIYKYAKRMKDEKYALKVFFIFILNPLNYLFLWWSYKYTLCLCLITGFIYCSFFYKNNNHNILVDILLGIIFSIGYLLNSIIIVPFIAFIIFRLLNNRNIRKYLIDLGVIFISIIIVLLPLKHYVDRYSPDLNKSYPVEHYIMMGLKGDGTYNKEDSYYTSSFDSTKDKRSADRLVIKDRLKGYKISGLIHHLFIKLPVTWSNGVSSFNDKLDNTLYPSYISRFVTGEKNDLLRVYCYCFRIIILLTVLLYVYHGFKDKNIDNEFYILLIILGAFVFYLIGEAKSSYSYPFIPIFFLISAYEFDNNLYDKFKIKRKYIMIATLIFFLCFYKSLCIDKTEFKNYSFYISEGVNNTLIGPDFTTIKQELYINNDFNNIELKAYKLEDSEDYYDVEIEYPDGCIESYFFRSYDIKNNYVTIEKDDICEVSKGKYNVSITNSEDSSSVSLYYMYLDSIDAYKGDFYYDDELINSDIFIRTYKSYKGSYISKICYIIVMIVTLIIEYYLFKQEKGGKSGKRK